MDAHCYLFTCTIWGIGVFFTKQSVENSLLRTRFPFLIKKWTLVFINKMLMLKIKF